MLNNMTIKSDAVNRGWEKGFDFLLSINVMRVGEYFD